MLSLFRWPYFHFRLLVVVAVACGRLSVDFFKLVVHGRGRQRRIYFFNLDAVCHVFRLVCHIIAGCQLDVDTFYKLASCAVVKLPSHGWGSLSLKLLDYTFVRLGEKFRTSIKHSIPPCTRKVCFCSQLKHTEP